jgi:hypothetical protein
VAIELADEERVALQALAPTDEPYGRSYTSADCEGHRWRFMNAG